MIKYFRLKRNFVVHDGFIDLTSKVEIKHTEYITVAPVGLTVDFYRVDKDGNRIEEEFSHGAVDYLDEIEKKSGEIIIDEDIEDYQPEILKLSAGAIAKSFYYFEEFPDKSVIELCKQYFHELVEINRIYGI